MHHEVSVCNYMYCMCVYLSVYVFVKPQCVCLLQCWAWRTAVRWWAASLCLWRDWRFCRPSWRTRIWSEPGSASTSTGEDLSLVSV